MASGFLVSLAQYAQPYSFYSGLGTRILIFFPVHQQQLCDEHLFKITFVYTVRVVEQHLKYPNQESILQVFH